MEKRIIITMTISDKVPKEDLISDEEAAEKFKSYLEMNMDETIEKISNVVIEDI